MLLHVTCCKPSFEMLEQAGRLLGSDSVTVLSPSHRNDNHAIASIMIKLHHHHHHRHHHHHHHESSSWIIIMDHHHHHHHHGSSSSSSSSSSWVIVMGHHRHFNPVSFTIGKSISTAYWANENSSVACRSFSSIHGRSLKSDHVWHMSC